MPLRQNKIKFLILLLLVCVLGVGLLKIRSIEDWLALRNYQAPQPVASLATQDTMTSYARHIFYVNHPRVADKSSFATECPNDGGEKTIVLGCYHSNQAGIYVLSVNDPRLKGVEQVTAAHEMLHAAYDRLSSSERTRIDNMLLDYYNHDLHNQRIINTIAAYKKSEPHNVVNEMHSVFGTEIANLPSGLEQYYTRYFTNRQIITDYAAQYEAAFTLRQNQVNTDDIQLTSLKTQINSYETDLKSRYSQITTEQNQLSDLENSDPVSYNSEVPAYNQLVNEYNSEAATLKGLVDQYNQIVATRNAVALEEDDLVNELNDNINHIN
jgi:hypothetical protein